MTDLTLTDVERLERALEAEAALHMDEEAFKAFYERTARSVWAYLSRMVRDPQRADDLLQEAYYRFLRADRAFDTEAHRRNYLFRIATNLVKDHRRRLGHAERHLADGARTEDIPAGVHEGDRAVRRLDLARAMEQMKPRERSLLWLAYAQGCSHEEIAEVLGLRKASMKALLFRARKRLLRLLGATDVQGERR